MKIYQVIRYKTRDNVILDMKILVGYSDYDDAKYFLNRQAYDYEKKGDHYTKNEDGFIVDNYCIIESKIKKSKTA